MSKINSRKGNTQATTLWRHTRKAINKLGRGGVREISEKHQDVREYMFSGGTRRWVCQEEDCLKLSGSNIQGTALITRETYNVPTMPLREWLRSQRPIFCGSPRNLSPLPPPEATWETKGFLSRYAMSTFNTQIYLSWIEKLSHTLSPWSLLHQKPSPFSIPKTMSCHPCSHLPLPLNHNTASTHQGVTEKDTSDQAGQPYV